MKNILSVLSLYLTSTLSQETPYAFVNFDEIFNNNGGTTWTLSTRTQTVTGGNAAFTQPGTNIIKQSNGVGYAECSTTLTTEFGDLYIFQNPPTFTAYSLEVVAQIRTLGTTSTGYMVGLEDVTSLGAGDGNAIGITNTNKFTPTGRNSNGFATVGLGTYTTSIASETPFTNTDYYHIIVTQNTDGTVTTYVNGQQYGSSYAGTAISVNAPFGINVCDDGTQANPSGPFNIVAFGFYIKELTPIQVSSACTAAQAINSTAFANMCNTGTPTMIPTTIPTGIPTAIPTGIPTIIPTITASDPPTNMPTTIPTLSPIVQCVKGTNYAIDGNLAMATGDPHYRLWNGDIHDFQGSGSINNQYYYIKPCFGNTNNQLPFSILGTHYYWVGTSAVRSIDYMTIQLFDPGNGYYLIFLNPTTGVSRYTPNSVPMSTSTLLDNNPITLTTFTSNVQVSIGVRFKATVIQTSATRIDFSLRVFGSNTCGVDLYMTRGRVTTGGTPNRNRANNLYVNPPECFRCYTCGLLGDFKRSALTGSLCRLPKCDSAGWQTVQQGWRSSNPQSLEYRTAYDFNGLTWRKGACNRRRRLQSGPSGPLNNTVLITDPCPIGSSITNRAITECQNVRNSYTTLCGNIASICDKLQSDCEYDACAAANGNINNVATEAQNVFGNTLGLLTTLNVQNIFDPNAVLEAAGSPTGAPTLKPTLSPTTPKCQLGVNYWIRGNTAVADGDPHFYLFNGDRHDFQGVGSINNQYYYVTRCAGVRSYDMPFNILGRQVPWVRTSNRLRGLDYITIQLLAGNNQVYLIWLNPRISKFTPNLVPETTSTLFDSNPITKNSFPNNVRFNLGRFGLKFRQININQCELLLYIDNIYVTKMFMRTQATFNSALQRFQGNYFSITPPLGYQCRICGLLGGFKRSRINGIGCRIPRCQGGWMNIQQGYGNFRQGTLGYRTAFSFNGLTWRKSSQCPRGNTNPRRIIRRLIDDGPDGPDTLNITITDPCPANTEVYNKTIIECQRQRDIYSDLCNGVLQTKCNELQESCNLDACAGADGNLTVINDLAMKIYGETLGLFNSSREEFEKAFNATDLIGEPGEPTDNPTLNPTIATTMPTMVNNMTTTTMDSNMTTTDGNQSSVSKYNIYFVIYICLFFIFIYELL